MKTKLYKQYLVIGIIILLFGTTFSIGNVQGNSENIEMQQSQTIVKHPAIVAKVKAKARENQDIPTKIAVLSLH